MRYDRGSVNSAINAALKMGGHHFVSATAYGWIIEAKKPPFNLDFYEIDNGEVTEHDRGIVTDEWTVSELAAR